MPRTFVRQTQSNKSDLYDDAIGAGSTMESASTDVETDLNAIRSQIKRYAGETKWYTDKSGRDLKTTASDLLDLEGKKLLFRAQVLTDVAVPAQVRATGTLTGVTAQNFANTETVTIDAKVYTFQTVLTDVDGNVLIGADMDGSLANLKAAMNLEAGGGTNYAASMTLHPTVESTAAASLTLSARAKSYGAVGNNIATTETAAQASWGAVTLTGGAGDIVVLSVSGSEAPSETAAVDAGTAAGALVKVLTGDVGVHSLAEITGANALSPKNLMVVRDADSGDPIMSSGKLVWALIQAESGVVDGNTFNDTDKQVQLSFVRENATADDLEACPAADIQGKDVNYSYVRRIALDNIPEQAFLTGMFVDQSSAVDVTLDNAIDNQSGPATQVQNIEVRITDTKSWAFEDSTGADKILEVAAASGADAVNIKAQTVTIVNAGNVDISNGMVVDSSGTDIDIGVTAGQIGSVGKLDLVTAAASDLSLLAGGQVIFSDTYFAGSGYDTPLVLSDSSAEWDAYDTAFGEVSLLNAVVQAYSKAKHDKKVAAATTNIDPDVNVTGGASPNLDAQLLDYTGKTFVDDVDVFLNGVLLRNGADASANHDVYPGTAVATGDLKFEFKIKSGDQITMNVW